MGKNTKPDIIEIEFDKIFHVHVPREYYVHAECLSLFCKDLDYMIKLYNIAPKIRNSLIQTINDLIYEFRGITDKVDSIKKTNLQSKIKVIIQSILEIFPRSENISLIFIHLYPFNGLMEKDIECLILERFDENYSSLRMKWSSLAIGDDSIVRRLAEENIKRIQHTREIPANYQSLDSIELEVKNAKDQVKRGSCGGQVSRFLVQMQYYAEIVKGSKSFYDGKYFDCLRHFHQATELIPEEGNSSGITGWMNKGAILHDLGEYVEAIRCFDTAINIMRGTRDPSALYYRACSNFKLGNVENGLADLEEAIESDKKYIKLAKYEKNFESIRRDERFKAILNIT